MGYITKPMQNHTSELLIVKLNNFIHRIDCKASIIELFTQHHCSVKRIRRSKNWQLTGTQAQLTELSDILQKDKTAWIADAIDKALPTPSFNLALIIKSTPTITVNQLMAKTGCSLVEARSAIDTAENFIE